MARRRKTESKAPIKQEPKSLVRKSSRQKAKKKQLGDGEVDIDTCENKNNLKNFLDTKSEQDDSNNENDASKNLDQFKPSHDQPALVADKILNDASSCENTIEETTIYEEMEIETESSTDILNDNPCSQVLFNNDFELNEDKMLQSNNSRSVDCDSYQMVQKGLSGLHVSEICESSTTTTATAATTTTTTTTTTTSLDNFNGKFEISYQNEEKKNKMDVSVDHQECVIEEEEESRDKSMNSKMDLEDNKPSSSSESSSDSLFPRACGILNNDNKSGEDKDAENGSNHSGVRRSNRIKHIGLQKQKSRGRGLVVKPIQDAQKVLVCDSLTSRIPPVPEEEQERVASQDNLSINCDSNANRPVKVKSRWRRSSELEMNTCWSTASAVAAPESSNFAGSDIPVGAINKEGNCNNDSWQLAQESNDLANEDRVKMITANDSSQDVINNIGAKMLLPMVPEVDREMEERLSQFEHLRENLYLTERYTNKDTKRMVCDCFLTEEEIQRGELGCGEDCLNRLLMIECGSRCIVGDRCTNRRFQNCDYAKCQVFRTEKKGFGLRAMKDLNAGEFIMEYVGEVVDSRDFRKRAKEYSKDKNRHYYFMALKSDQIIDATMKGNISRFINHSCDPNAETQKWTVNGELRIGFFNKKFVAAGEEITFDYHFQRYGKEAQKCFCEAANCRGWIGDNPKDGKATVECTEDEDDDEDGEDDDDDDEDEDEKDQLDDKEEEEKKKKKKVEAKKEKRTRRSKREDKKKVDHMEDEDLEEQIDKLCASGLKNRSHTLTLSRLMVRCRELQHRKRLLEVIQSGEQPCRRLFLDYHGLRLMWSYMMDVAGLDTDEAQQFRLEIVKTLTRLPIPNRTMLIDSKVLSVVDKWSKQLDEHAPSGDSPDDEQQQQQVTVCEEVEIKPTTTSDKDSLSDLAGHLLESWSSLKEVFRIPKKERLEQMKEHEREADRGYKEDAEREVRETASYVERHRSAADKRLERRRGGPLTAGAAAAGEPLEERPNLVQVPRMSKFERRQLFALKVAKEEEERQRRQQEELWQQHQAQCLALGVDPYTTAALDPQSGYPLLFDPQLGQWQAFPGLQAEQPAGLYQQQQQQQQLQQQQQQQQLSGLAQPASAHNGGGGDWDLESATGGLVQLEQPPPALDLPPKWKWARDKRGRIYYYHTRERVSQWLPPPPDHIGLQPDSGLDSSSDETSGDDDDDDDDDDDESISDKDEEDEADDEQLPVAGPLASSNDAEASVGAQVSSTGERDEPPGDDEAVDQVVVEDQQQQQPQQQQLGSLDTKKRRAGLVQERIISPRREEDRIDHSKFKELKDKLRRQKEKSRLKEHFQSTEKERKHRRSLKSKSHAKQSSQFKTITSDMSPTSERKIKDTFRINMAHVMVHFLNPYRKNDCKQGRITNTEDFKYLARKLTHFVLAKELKHCKSVDELECNDNVKHKAKDFVRKYMNKFGTIYQRDKDDD